MVKRILFLTFFLTPPNNFLWADLSDLSKEEKTLMPQEEKDLKSTQAASPAPTTLKPKEEPKSKKKTASKNKKTVQDDGSQQKLPITYTGEVLFGSKQLGKVSIEQKVNVNQGDLSLRADKADIFFLESQEGVDKVNAVGNVNIDKLDVKTKKMIKASGNFAQFDAKANTILIKGDAKLQRGDDLIQGNYIIYDMKTGGIEAGKVAGVVSPTEKEDQK